MEPKDWMNFGVAVYAAVTASALLIWNILRARTKAKIRLLYTYKIPYNGIDDRSVGVEFINRGEQKINLVQIGLKSSKTARLQTVGLLDPSEFNLPTWVQPKDRTTLQFTREHIKNFRREPQDTKEKLKYIFVADATGKHYNARLPKGMKELLLG